MNPSEAKPITIDGILEGYICEKCKGTILNPQTGRCARCNYPSENFGYCKKCDKFWSISDGMKCPEHNKKLIAFKAVTTYRRIDNLLIDSFLILIISIPFWKVLFKSDLLDIDLWHYAAGPILFFFYYFFFESIWQRTPAKFITGTKVITYSGEKPSVSKIFLRTFIRFIPFEAFSFLGAKVRGWHDKFSDTYVIQKPAFGCGTISVFSPSLQEKTCGMATVSFLLSMFPLMVFCHFLLSSMFRPLKARDYDYNIVTFKLIFFSVFVIYILAIIFGIKALKKIKKSMGVFSGKGYACFGIGISSSFFLLIIFSIIIIGLRFDYRRLTFPEKQVMLTKENLVSLQKAVSESYHERGYYPTNAEGLQILIKTSNSDDSKSVRIIKPTTSTSSLKLDLKYLESEYKKGQKFRYLKSSELPKDGWGRDFIYKSNPTDKCPFVIISLGADGKEGGDGFDKDISSIDFTEKNRNKY